MGPTTAPAPPATRRRRTQQERSDETRTKLLDATLECLVDLGYAGTSTTEVSKRAGLSRGAQLHHFPNKAELVSAAIEHLSRRRMDEFRTRVGSQGDGVGHLDELIDLLWSGLSGSLFSAAVELSVAARTDTELQHRFGPLEQRITHRMTQLLQLELVAVGATPERADQLARFTRHILMGLAYEAMTARETASTDTTVKEWKATLASLL